MERIDKWLWTIRVYKTRTMATDACRGGKVKLNGTNVKPSREIKKGEIYHVGKDQQKLIFQVIDAPPGRLSADKVPIYALNLSPVPDKNEFIPSAFHTTPQRDAGAGRPTKRDRREIDDLMDF